MIKKPLSLTGVRKRVRGQHGREPPTHVSDFKSWDAFEEEVATIWENARIYNEDGSDMYNLAGEFEVRAAHNASTGHGLTYTGTFQDATCRGQKGCRRTTTT